MALEKQQRRLTTDMPGLRNEVATTIPILRTELGPPGGFDTNARRQRIDSGVNSQR